MNREIAVLALIMLVIATSGCASIRDGCAGTPCEDACSGDTRLHSGSCSSGECSYTFETCEHGCSGGECNARPPHLVFEIDEEGKGGFSLAIAKAEITLGEEGTEEKDSYEFQVKVTNRGGSDGIFSVKGASIVGSTGLMHSTVGYGWSNFMYVGYIRHITFRIAEVPTSLREQNTTIIIRTNQGNYYYQASFEY